MIYQTLKQKIYDGKYKPGEKLVIARLAKDFECSDIPVREALNLLESEKLILFKPHIGAIVSPLSLEEIKEIFGVRVILEG
ncbi:GntR family transcriptional regulator [Bacillus sp. Bva_UNVM-123]|uniref:GntR family transcriptional regulator n=1 Tax=Bacillus sp. Bva_UNVM-123 TaxID=2829798 RepID=UPI00391EE9E4